MKREQKITIGQMGATGPTQLLVYKCAHSVTLDADLWPDHVRLSQRVKTPRLRRKGPQWRQVALFVFVADVLLAAAAWVAVDFFLR